VPKNEDTFQHYAFARRGAAYASTEDELRTLQYITVPESQKSTWHGLPLPVDLKTAHRELEALAHTAFSQRQEEARHRLLAAYNLPSQKMTADLFIKIFNDLDIVLFNGMLRNRVHIQWKIMRGAYFAGLTTEPTWTSESTVPLKGAKISLNLHMDSKELAPEYFWGVVVHEMLHAYLAIVTHNETLEHDTDDPNGPLFRRSGIVLAWRLDFPEFLGSDIYRWAADPKRLGIIVPCFYKRVTDLACFRDVPED
jgi:hypothetical protein